ncbi:MAG: hypothetical protein IPM81_22565 [Saprospirales bacterium]|jgi:hypothetical protein|nr:hypothetical protein [Saprospirales bacterium]MBK8965293.1 hypothetical protein [Lewinellaceae bacterium]MBL7795868.1 hypothetical protein [Saprospiraceae bacterium]MBL7797691.1 hypothetical protein [Saprospiraceae bacterium]
MYYLTILKKDAREIGYLVAESPFRDSKEQDEHIDIRLDQTTEEEAVLEATKFVERHRLTYWEVHHVVQVAGCHITNGDWD